MIAVLDTHAFIWMDSDPGRVPHTVLDYLTDPHCTVYLSVVSVWEIIIKVRTQKLSIRTPIEQLVADNLINTPLKLLPVRVEHAFALGQLQLIHKDPFDRVLIAQALAENAVLLTSDPVIRQYPVRTDW